MDDKKDKKRETTAFEKTAFFGEQEADLQNEPTVIDEKEVAKIKLAKDTGRIARIKEQLSYKDSSKKYRLDGEMARGGMGVIHKIYDKELHRHLVMKVLIPKEVTGNEEVEKISKLFLEEAQLSAQLEHPNILPVHDIGIFPNGELYFTMKLVLGRELAEVIAKLKKGEENYVKKYNSYDMLIIFRKVCDAVAFAHSRGVVHRDIKPANIMIGRYGEVILMDWGLAKFLGDEIPQTDQDASVHSQRLYTDFDKTMQGSIQGTPHYMAPEQIRGTTNEIDHLSDIYLLGATLYHMMAFVPPHQGKSFHELARNIDQGNIVPPHERNITQQIPEELSRIIMKAMALERKDRYQSVKALADDVDDLIAGHIVSEPSTFKTGQFLIRQGEVGREGYVLLKGKVEVFQRIGEKSTLLTTMGPGDIVGEMAIITSDKRSADVVAAEDTEVLVIDEHQFHTLLKRVPPWMEKVIVRLVDRLRLANKNVHELLIDDPTYQVLRYLCIKCESLAYMQKQEHIENIVIDIDEMTQAISVMLCIPNERILEVLERLFATELCEKLPDGKVKFLNFLLFHHVVDFLHEVYEIETPTRALRLDEETKIHRCKLAARISKRARELLSHIPIYANLVEDE